MRPTSISVLLNPGLSADRRQLRAVFSPHHEPCTHPCPAQPSPWRNVPVIARLIKKTVIRAALCGRCTTYYSHATVHLLPTAHRYTLHTSTYAYTTLPAAVVVQTLVPASYLGEQGASSLWSSAGVQENRAGALLGEKTRPVSRLFWRGAAPAVSTWD